MTQASRVWGVVLRSEQRPLVEWSHRGAERRCQEALPHPGHRRSLGPSQAAGPFCRRQHAPARAGGEGGGADGQRGGGSAQLRNPGPPRGHGPRSSLPPHVTEQHVKGPQPNCVSGRSDRARGAHSFCARARGGSPHAASGLMETAVFPTWSARPPSPKGGGRDPGVWSLLRTAARVRETRSPRRAEGLVCWPLGRGPWRLFRGSRAPTSDRGVSPADCGQSRGVSAQ